MDTDDPAWEEKVEEAIEAWHDEHRGPGIERAVEDGHRTAPTGSASRE